MAQNDANTDDSTDQELMDVLAALAGEGRVEVEDKSRHHTELWLETPEGTIQFSDRAPDSVMNEGADHTRRWTWGDYKLSYSIDRTPGNRTNTVLVKEVDR